MNNLYNSLLLKGYSKEAAEILAARFPEISAGAIYEMATEGSKEELIRLCESDTDLYDEEDGSYKTCTWDYIEKKYVVLKLSNEIFIIISIHQQ